MSGGTVDRYAQRVMLAAELVSTSSDEEAAAVGGIVRSLCSFRRYNPLVSVLEARKLQRDLDMAETVGLPLMKRIAPRFDKALAQVVLS